MLALRRAPFVALFALAGCGGGRDPVAEGKAFVLQRGCASCHQSPNPADGVLSGQVTPLMDTRAYAGNLTPDTATGLGGWADIQIVRAMRYGVDNQYMYLCRPMPHYDGTDPTVPEMTTVEADAIVVYLRTLPPVARTIPRSVCAARPGRAAPGASLD